MRGRARSGVGHNPLGGWSVLLMLACLAVQTASGLFASDDITETGPLAARVSEATVALMTRIHNIDRWVLLALIALHVVAVLMHWVIRDDNLVAPMLHGRKQTDEMPALRLVSPWRALLLAIASALAVWALIAWLGS
jgi:cytochrome b